MSRKYEDDDGRTIADMSGLDQRSVLSGTLAGLQISKKRREQREPGKRDSAIVENAPYKRDSDIAVNAHYNGERSFRSVETSEDKKIRRTYTLGAMGAGLLIGLIYLAGFGLLILLLLLLWHAF